MRPVQILDVPVTDPYVCIKCGLGLGSDRRHYVDLGVDSHMKQKDEFNQVHLFEGVIYFCNMCMMDLIVVYLSNIFNFVNTQENTYNHFVQEKQDGFNTLQNEISMLREQLNKRDDEVKDLNNQLTEFRNISAEELLKGVLGGRDIEDDAGSDSDSEGTDQSSDGNSPTDESADFTADSLFQLHLAIAERDNTINR